MNDKKKFLKVVKVLYDTREQKNAHIINALAEMGVMTEQRKLDFGDYSFMAEDKDFSMSCVIERKANVDELYTNVMQDRGRIEKELYAAASLGNDFVLLIENVGSWDELKLYEVPESEMMRLPDRKVKMIGAHVHAALKAWCPNNRYRFRVEFVKDETKTAARMLEIFYYYWHNYKELTAARR